MSVNLTIEAPPFELIKKEAGPHTADSIRLLWAVANQEAAERRTGVRIATERIAPKSRIDSPGAAQNDYDTQYATIVRFDGAVAVNVTGFKARAENTLLIVLVLGSATITLKHDSANSEARNRILLASGADKAILTNQSVLLLYENTRWRELELA